MNILEITRSWRGCEETKRIKNNAAPTSGVCPDNKALAIKLLKQGKPNHFVSKATGINKTSISQYKFNMKNHFA